MNFKKISLNVLFLVLMLLPSLVFAGPFTPSDNDKSMEIIVKQLFGPLVGGGDSPLSAIVDIFNRAVLIVGGILVAYTLVAGTLQTAHDGEMLGKKWSSLWVPVRTALGTAAILPIQSGFCFAQIVVVWLAVQGIGIADKVWGAFLNQELNTAQTYIPPSSQKAIRGIVVELLKSHSCAAAATEEVKKTVNGEVLNINKGVTGSPNSTGIVFGDRGGCGSFALQKPQEGSQIDGEFGGFFNTNKFEAELYPVHANQLFAASDAMKTWGEAIAKSETQGDFQGRLNAAIDAQTKQWSEALQNQATATYASATNDKFIKSMQDEGWLMAGMWYMQFAKAGDAVARGVSAVPAVGARVEAGSGLAGQLNELDRMLEVGPLDAMSTSRAIARADELTRVSSSSGANLVDHVGSEQGGMAGKFISFFINDDLRGINSFGKDAQLHQNPVLMAANLGNNLASWGWASFWLGVAAGSVSSASGAGFSLGSGFATMISPMITALAGTIIVSGTTLAVYIPMLPYILWIGVVFGWSVLLIEAVIAAPLWAVTHLAPDGDGVVGRGGQGYMLVLSLTLRPALMVIGFASAVILMKPIGYLINSTFMGAFITNVAPSPISIVQIITGCVIYCVLMSSIITRIFALIHVIPDRLLRWIGGGGNELGGEAGQLEHATGAKAMAGVAAAHSIGGAGQQGIQNMRNLRAQERGNMRSDVGNKAQLEGNANDRARSADRATTGALGELRSAGADVGSAQQNFDSAQEQADNFRNQMDSGEIPRSAENMQRMSQLDNAASQAKSDLNMANQNFNIAQKRFAGASAESVKGNYDAAISSAQRAVAEGAVAPRGPAGDAARSMADQASSFLREANQAEQAGTSKSSFMRAQTQKAEQSGSSAPWVQAMSRGSLAADNREAVEASMSNLRRGGFVARPTSDGLQAGNNPTSDFSSAPQEGAVDVRQRVSSTPPPSPTSGQDRET